MRPDPPPPPAPLPPPVGTPMEGDDDHRLLAEPARQSPIALVFIAWRFVRRLGLSALLAAFVFVANGGLAVGGLIFALVVTTTLLAVSALSWWRFTFVVTGEGLVVTKGIVSVERLVIPLDRIQSVSIDQRFVHRFVGLVRAAVDTAGSSGAEFEIDAIDRPRAEALRRVAADARHDRVQGDAAAPPEPVVEEVVLRRSFAELVVVGVTRLPWTGLVALVPLIAVVDELGRFDAVSEWFDRFADRTSGVESVAAALATIGIAVVALTIFGLLLQVTRVVLANWDLTLTLTSRGELRRTAGLLSTTSRSSTLRRVQTITTDDSPPQRWLGITTLRLRVFGDNDIILPGSRGPEVDALRALVFGAAEPPALDRMISRWVVFRTTRNAAVFAAAVATALWFAVGWWSLLALALVPIRWAEGRRRWRLRRWGLDDDRLAESYRFVAGHTAELPVFKAQVVSVTQSWFERRRGLATVTVRSADGFLAVPMIDHVDAMAVRDRVLYAVETDRRRFL